MPFVGQVNLKFGALSNEIFIMLIEDLYKADVEDVGGVLNRLNINCIDLIP